MYPHRLCLFLDLRIPVIKSVQLKFSNQMVLGILCGLRPVQTKPTCWSNITQHCWMQHVGLVCRLCWIMLEDVGLSLNLLKIFVQHCATLLAQQCCKMLASFEQASSECVFYKNNLQLLSMIKFTIPVYIWLH